MLRLSCPWCGERDEREFVCGGETPIIRPPEPERVSDGEWADYLFNRSNRKGRHTERWQHRFGCRQWFIVERDTVTHEIRPAGAKEGQ
jgi:heterotetrameric sarcosine oxidase delta subunit